MVPFKYVPNVYKAINTHPHMEHDGFSNFSNNNQTATHLKRTGSVERQIGLQHIKKTLVIKLHRVKENAVKRYTSDRPN